MAERESGFTPIPRNLQFRVGLLLGLTAMLAIGFVLYALYARGVFEATQRLTLLAENAEGIAIGSDLSYSGLPIGRVQRIALGDDGLARIEIVMARSDARWLRTSSKFGIERGLFGTPRLRAHSANLRDPPLADRAVREVSREDTSEEIPRMVASLRGVLENLDRISNAEGPVQSVLADLRALTQRLNGRYGALGVLLGGDEQAAKVIAAVERTNALLASLEATSRRLDAVVGRTEQRLLAEGGVLEGTQQAVTQVNALLGEMRATLKSADRVLAEAKEVTGNAKAASTDLGQLRADVDASLRKLRHLIEEIDRKWPFERDTELRLP